MQFLTENVFCIKLNASSETSRVKKEENHVEKFWSRNIGGRMKFSRKETCSGTLNGAVLAGTGHRATFDEKWGYVYSVGNKYGRYARGWPRGRGRGWTRRSRAGSRIKSEGGTTEKERV